MTAALTLAQQDQAPSTPDNPARRCLVTGELRPKEELIRFVVDPEKNIVPDLAQSLPGRGLWITAERAAIEMAVSKNLFARAAKTSAKADPLLPSIVFRLQRRRCLDFLGFARSAGLAILGQPQVEAGLKAGKIALLLVACDAAPNGLEKVGSTAIEPVRSLTRDELGAALGHDQLVYIGLKAHKLTERLRSELARLEKLDDRHHLSSAKNG